MPLNTFILRVFLALVLGCLIGLERQWRQRMAGTRTNGLVASGACAFVLMGAMSPHDPTGAARVLGQVVTGIGFLGAGVIFKEGMNIRGLNTAATIWASAAVGALSALGFPVHSAVMAFFVILVNATLRPLAYKLQPVGAPSFFTVSFDCHMFDQKNARDLLFKTAARLPAKIEAVDTRVSFEEVAVTAKIMTIGHNERLIDRLAHVLSSKPGITDVKWESTPTRPAELRTGS
jgi:putative Mg2+ transporter-C (MgtC) family protein